MPDPSLGQQGHERRPVCPGTGRQARLVGRAWRRCGWRWRRPMFRWWSGRRVRRLGGERVAAGATDGEEGGDRDRSRVRSARPEPWHVPGRPEAWRLGFGDASRAATSESSKPVVTRRTKAYVCAGEGRSLPRGEGNGVDVESERLLSGLVHSDMGRLCSRVRSILSSLRCWRWALSMHRRREDRRSQGRIRLSSGSRPP